MGQEDATARPRLSRRAAKLIALAILAIGMASMAIVVPLQVVNVRAEAPRGIIVVGDRDAPGVATIANEIAGRDFTQGGPGGGVVVVFLLCLLWLGVGTLIVSRQPGNWAGWIFIAVGMPFLLLNLTQALLVYGLRTEPGSVPWLTAWALLGENALYPVALVPLLFLLYPDGHLPGPRWRWAVRGLIGGTLLALLGFLLRPGPFNNFIDSGILVVNPTGVEGLATVAGAIIAIGAIVALVSALSTAIAVVMRFRRSTGELRQQMRVLAVVGAISASTLVLLFLLDFVASFILNEAEGDSTSFEVFFAIPVLTLVIGTPAAYLIAIFRHGLWDLDYVIKKTVQYAVVVAVFMLIGFLVIGAIPALLVGAGDGADALPVLLLAAVLTAVFLWLRPRAGRLANRLVYRKRATPYEVLSEFSERVGETYSTDDVLPRMAQLVADATGALRIDVWLVVRSSLRAEASWPDAADTAAPRRIVAGSPPTVEGEYLCEVRHQGELLGAITLTPSPDDPMNRPKELLVHDLAAQAGLVLRNVRLIEDLRASRQRLVAAQDDERRKIERDIHDGAQQQLVALQVQQRLAEQLVDRDPAKAKALLGQLQDDTGAALDDLRDLARGIYPPLLADHGLGAALEAQARKSPTPITVDAGEIGRYGQEVESAVYFSCLEALQNVAKYADAPAATVTLTQRNGALEFSIRDDGRGFEIDRVPRGSGLQGIADRIDAIGGTLTIESDPGSGTTVRGSVPIGDILPRDRLAVGRVKHGAR